MIFSRTAVTASLVFSSLIGALAQPIHHAHNIHKRDDVVVVQVINYVDGNGNVVSAETISSVSPATTPAAAAPAAPAATTTSAAPVVVEPAAAAPSSSSVVVAAPVASSSSSSSAAAAAATPSSSPSVSTSSGSFGAGAKGVVYSPYKVGGCKTAAEVAADFASLGGFELIRIYGVDCDQVTNVKAALQPGQKLFLGIFDVANLQSGLASLTAAIGSDWDLVHTVSIGNELVNNGQASVSQIASYVSAARPILSAAGYTGPVVSVDTFIAVINNPGLCEISDYIAVNAHAYFDGGITSSGAGEWTLQQIQRVSTACGNSKSVFISEAGWPHAGDSNGVANASPADQATAISGIKSSCGSDTVLFTAFNDYWKNPGSLNIEQNFGVFGDSASS